LRNIHLRKPWYNSSFLHYFILQDIWKCVAVSQIVWNFLATQNVHICAPKLYIVVLVIGTWWNILCVKIIGWKFGHAWQWYSSMDDWTMKRIMKVEEPTPLTCIELDDPNGNKVSAGCRSAANE
jgi:hypothetical protein